MPPHTHSKRKVLDKATPGTGPPHPPHRPASSPGQARGNSRFSCPLPSRCLLGAGVSTWAECEEPPRHTAEGPPVTPLLVVLQP